MLSLRSLQSLRSDMDAVARSLDQEPSYSGQEYPRAGREIQNISINWKVSGKSLTVHGLDPAYSEANGAILRLDSVSLSTTGLQLSHWYVRECDSVDSCCRWPLPDATGVDICQVFMPLIVSLKVYIKAFLSSSTSPFLTSSPESSDQTRSITAHSLNQPTEPIL